MILPLAGEDEHARGGVEVGLKRGVTVMLELDQRMEINVMMCRRMISTKQFTMV